MKEIFKKWWFWVLGGLIFLYILLSILILIQFPDSFWAPGSISLKLESFFMTLGLFSFLFIPLYIIVVSFISFIYMLINYKKQVFRKWWFWVLLGLFIFAIWFIKNLKLY
jgi:hypothetical protein